MAGNPCEELSPTGGKKKKKEKKRKRKTEPDLTALFSGSLRIKSSQLINHKCSSKTGDLPRTQRVIQPHVPFS